MVDVGVRFPVDRHRALSDEIRSIAREHPEVSTRSGRQLRRALAANRLAVATDEGRVVGWFLSERSPGAAHELGYLFVDPGYRSGVVFDRMLRVLLALEPFAVAVTFRPAFARWLTRSYGFEDATLGSVAALTKGTFVLRRCAPGRLSAAIRHTSEATPLYLVWRSSER